MICIMNMAGRTDADGRFRLNPYSGKIFYITVYPPDGKPYLSYQKEIKLPPGQQPPQVEIALPRSVLLRGKITEKASGDAVAGAAVEYEEQSRRPYRPDRIPPDHSPPSVRGISRADGTYQIAIPPGRGTLFVQGPRNDYIRQTINTWDFNNDREWTIAVRNYVSAYASLDVKPKQETAELNFALRRGLTVRGSIVGPDNRPVGDALMLSRHFLRGDEHTWRGGHIRVKNGKFELHGLDPVVGVPFYFLDPQHETGATVAISGKSADQGPLVVHLQPCGKAVARFVDRQGKPKVKYRPGLQILVSPGPFRGDRKRNKKEVSSDQDFVANFDREHYWDEPVTDEEGRCTFPALIPGATYRIDLMNKLGDWDERDFSVKSGETLRLPDIVVPTPPSKPAAKAAAGADAWKPGQVLDFRVINAKTKEPLSGVKLELQYHGPGINFQDVKIQTTDARGRSEIRLPDRRPDAVRVYPSKPGFVPLRIYWGDDLPSPALPKTVTVPLEPGTAWGGVVRNEQGQPIPAVKVTVHYWESPAGNPQPHRRANIDAETTADKDGRWRLDVLPAEVIEDQPRIFLSHSDYVSDHLRPGMIPLPITKRPSVEALRAQTAVMTMRKGGVLEGRVVDETGRPVAGAHVYTDEYYWLDGHKPATTTDNDGQFRVAHLSFAQSGLNDPPPSTMRAIQQGDVALVVQAAGYTPQLIHADPNGSAKPLRISLQRGRAVEGRVVNESGQPIAGVSISVSNWLGYRERLHLTAKTDAAGKFRLADAPAAGVLYDLQKNGYMEVHDFSMSPQPTGKESYQVTLKGPLQVAGSIVDAETNRPLAKCTVLKGVEFDDGRAPDWQRFMSTKTITDGRYQFEFSGGVFAWRIRVEADGYMPAVSRIFKPGDLDKGRVTYDFKLSKAAPLTGTVLGPDGKPLAGAEIILATQLLIVNDRIASSQTLRNAGVTRTDAAGRFEFPPEVEPFYLVVLHDQGYAVINEKQFAAAPAIRLQPWTAENRSFRAERQPVTHGELPRAAEAKRSLLVRVVDAEGKPVEGAHVCTETPCTTHVPTTSHPTNPGGVTPRMSFPTATAWPALPISMASTAFTPGTSTGSWSPSRASAGRRWNRRKPSRL